MSKTRKETKKEHEERLATMQDGIDAAISIVGSNYSYLRKRFREAKAEPILKRDFIEDFRHINNLEMEICRLKAFLMALEKNRPRTEIKIMDELKTKLFYTTSTPKPKWGK